MASEILALLKADQPRPRDYGSANAPRFTDPDKHLRLVIVFFAWSDTQTHGQMNTTKRIISLLR